MEQSKAFYENSTRQLVNILECLSTQLTSNNSCQTRHCSSASHDNHDNIDSDSFDSLLSRQSYEQSQSSIASQRPSLDSYKQSEDVEVTSPIYENVYYKNHPHLKGMFFTVYMVRVLSYRAHFSMGAKKNVQGC